MMPSLCRTLVRSSGLSRVTFRPSPTLISWALPVFSHAAARSQNFGYLHEKQIPRSAPPQHTRLLFRPEKPRDLARAFRARQHQNACAHFLRDREDDFAELLALLQAPVRLNRFGQRKDAINHGP